MKDTFKGNGTSISLQEASEYLQHETLANRFRISHFAGCTVLFNKDTLHPDVPISSVCIHTTKNGQGATGWVLHAVVSRAAFSRVLRNGEPYFTMMSLHTNNHHAIRQGIAKNVFLQSVLSRVTNKLTWWLVTSTVPHGDAARQHN